MLDKVYVWRARRVQAPLTVFCLQRDRTGSAQSACALPGSLVDDALQLTCTRAPFRPPAHGKEREIIRNNSSLVVLPKLHSALLFALPALLALLPGSAIASASASATQVQARGVNDDANVHLSAERSLGTAKRVAPAQPANIASRQNNPRRRHKRSFRRALQSGAGASSTITSHGLPYDRFYAGSGFTENDDNPCKCRNTRRNATDAPRANPPESFEPRQTVFASSYTTTRALPACADGNAPEGYFGFQLYFLGSADEWICRS